MSVYSARSLEVCDSHGFQFVAKLTRICHLCSHPLALATRQNLKKSHHLREQKITRVAAALNFNVFGNWLKHSFEYFIWFLKSSLILEKFEAKSSPNFMIIKIMFLNLLRGDDFLS